MGEEKKEILMVPVEEIIPNRFQPRLEFGDKELQDLSSSIKEHGVIQPLILRKLGDKFEIIAGERRYKASTMAGLTKVPAVIVDTDDRESAQMAIVENVQRKDLTSIEEAKSYQKLQEKGMTQEEIAKKIGVSQSAIANKLRLLSLDDSVKDALLKNQISERHARTLLSLVNQKDLQIQLLNKILNQKLTVKQTEDELHKMLGNRSQPISTPASSHEDVPDFAKLFQEISEDKEVKSNIAQQNIEEPKINEDAVNIEETLNSENTSINPFQEEKEEIPSIEKIRLDNPLDNELNENVPNNLIIEEFKEKQGINEELIVPLENSEKSISQAISNTRDFTKNLENDGYHVSTEEFDFEDMYQIVIKIKKS